MLAVSVRRFCGAFCGLICGAGAAVAVSGCGHTAALARGHVLGIALMEYRVRPAHVVAEAGRLRISVHNYGRITHNLVLRSASPITITSSAGKAGRTTTQPAHTPDLAPGQGTTLSVSLPPGRYSFASTIDNDAGLGTQGTLTVVSK